MQILHCKRLSVYGIGSHAAGEPERCSISGIATNLKRLVPRQAVYIMRSLRFWRRDPIATSNKTILHAMKLTAIILLAACLQVQATGYGQKLTLALKDAPMEKLFNEISVQTGYEFLYINKILENAKNITIQVKDASLESVLQTCFRDQPFNYRIREKVIIITPKTAEATVAPIAATDPVPQTVRGKIVNENGEPVIATVSVKGKKIATTTNDDGEFYLPEVDGDAILIITGVGLETREIKINSKTDLFITVKIALAPLEEAVIKGYYTTTKKFNTGSVSTVKAAEIGRQPVADPLAALQGRVPGLFIKQNKGTPGTTFNVVLRGKNSIANSNSPLFVVDGVPFITTTLTSSSYASGAGQISPLNSLNIEDIESIEILKDADATSIYGSRGANGVVLIATKKGRAVGSGLKVNVYTGAGKVTRTLDWMNREQYLAMRREALKNDGLSIRTNDYDLNGKWDTTRYADWQKVFIGGTSKVTDVQLSFSSGNSKTQFTLGSGYRKETTVFPGDYFDKKFSIHYGLTHISNNSRFNLNLLASYVNDNNQLPVEDLTRYIALAPNAPSLFDGSGNLNWQGNTFNNPFAFLKRRAKSLTNNLISNLAISYKLFEGLALKTSVGYNNIQMDQNMVYPLSSYSPQFQLPFNRMNQISNNSVHSWIIEPQLNYDKSIGGGKLNIIMGSTFQESIQEILSKTANNFSNDNLIENIQAAGAIAIDNYNYSQYRYNALYGRVGYIYKDRYILNLTGRRDGSSRFGPGKQFGNFGAIGAAWIFSEEKFIKKQIKVLSFGKIRGSYGTTGNDQLTPYQYLSSYSAINYAYQGLTGLVPTRLTNPDYRWEEIKKLEIALELGFINNRINLSIDWYRNRTSNQLVGYSLPSTAGFTSIQYNLPAVIENSGWEIQMNTTNIKSKVFTWGTNFNVSVPRNKLVSYPNIKGSPYQEQYDVGKSLFVLYYFHYLGINPSTGLYSFHDKNTDGSISYASDRSFFFNGQQYFGGLENSFSYRQWDLSFLVQFTKQTGQAFISNGASGSFKSGVGNQPLSSLQRWQKPEDNQALVQKYTTRSNATQDYFDASDYRIQDASYLRLKNLSISWDAPHSILKRIHVKNVRIYIEGQNLLTLTNYKGIDPETGGSLALPPIRMAVVGFKLGF